MAYPNVNSLPIAPSRLSRPSNFVNESTIFLDALPTYRIESNWFSSYINSQILNKYNFGTVDGIRSFPILSQFTDYNIEYTGDGITFTSNVDVFYDALYQHSTKLNSVGVWFDNILNEVGTAPYDLDKPLVSGITQPMSRNQNRDDFNTTSINFGITATNNVNSLYQSIYYTYITSCSNQNFGSITDTTIIKTIDGGSITDTNLTY